MIKLGLERIAGLLVQLSNPTWLAIHIAGTNGKGSVASYLSSLFLRSSQAHTGEVRIGKFTSPHLIDRWDCITINDQPVSQSLFLAIEQDVKSAALKLESQFNLHENNNEESKVSQFELLTATAFEIFSRQKCQLAVVECGLGGRLDATNALKSENVAVSIITKIGLDHQSFLGTTAPEIACEKAGIIRHEVPVVVDGTNTPEVKSAIKRIATEKQAELIETEGNGLQDILVPSNNIPLHQQQNMKVALLAFSTAIPRITTLSFQPVTDESTIQQVLSDTTRSYPGRLQSISIESIVPEYKQKILLDGAHNPQSATVLREYVEHELLLRRQQQQQELNTDDRNVKPIQDKESIPTPTTTITALKAKITVKVTWIIAMSQGKNAHEIFKILLESRRRKEEEDQDQVLCCGFGPADGMPWVQSMAVTDLVDVARNFTSNVSSHVDVVDALKYACLGSNSALGLGLGHSHDQYQYHNKIVVAGSLYLVSDLLRALRAGEKSKEKK